MKFDIFCTYVNYYHSKLSIFEIYLLKNRPYCLNTLI
jgi:hypothetical protein